MNSKNDLFLTSDDNSKRSYIEIMEATIRAIAASLSDDQAYAGMPPYDLRSALHTDELLPEKGRGFAAVLEEMAQKILPNMVRPASTRFFSCRVFYTTGRLLSYAQNHRPFRQN